ncbi:MAG TPA: molybdopterin-dependent oxidoreductase, partial [Fimbriimonadaceae bacterium]|nr:molybdopterin-dependent oxidoreductase [Fimbriimonadaceae bacterium]
VTALPATEMVTELCCIEGWSQIVKWTGVPLAQFLKTLNIEPDSMPAYVSAETPDGKYYVALDKESALHVQTLICWAMDGKPLVPDHGAPLRLVIPPKYGIKSLKRLGVLRLTNERPTDYWYERGYDWYAGL